jgi:putative aldouronate transport system permease protein
MDIFGDINIAGYQKAFERATTMVVTLPIMMVYPFIQKYFEKGLNFGSVKE